MTMRMTATMMLSMSLMTVVMAVLDKGTTAQVLTPLHMKTRFH